MSDNHEAIKTVSRAIDRLRLDGLAVRVVSGPPTVHELAGMAMQGMLSGPNAHDLDSGEIASDAYLFADAMIAERERREAK